MKKMLMAGAAVLTLSATLSADFNAHEWYIGVDKTFNDSGKVTNDYADWDADFDVLTFKIGRQNKVFDKFEFQYTQKTAKDTVYGSSDWDMTEYKFNGVTSLYSLSYEHYVMPYIEGAIGYGTADYTSWQFPTHLGIGIMAYPIEHLEISAGYRYSTTFAAYDDDHGGEAYIVQHGGIVFGAAVKF